jgi:hypothetical protein
MKSIISKDSRPFRQRRNAIKQTLTNLYTKTNNSELIDEKSDIWNNYDPNVKFMDPLVTVQGLEKYQIQVNKKKLN